MTRSTELNAIPPAMDAGRFTCFVAEYVAELEGRNHTTLTVRDRERTARHFCAWLELTRIPLADVDDDIIGRFSKHICRCGGYRRRIPRSPRYTRSVRLFLNFLIQRGIIAELGAPGAIQLIPPLVAEYQASLLRHRGLTERTAARHGKMVIKMLARLGGDPGAYSSLSVKRAVLAEANTHSAVYVKSMTTALRGYLRFLASSGLCAHALATAVPTVPQWRLSSLPRYLSTTDVDRLIASCDLATCHGVRDRAILLLLARLGLRGGDVLDMRLQDVDWHSGTLVVRGKGRREERLPLPQVIGEAILDYIEKSRPAITDDRLFLRSVAPFGPFGNVSTVSAVVRLALKRAGIADPPSEGANLLRHSAATHMLRGGATLHSVGAVLRHRSLETTRHYAKVDFKTLATIAQPWPGEPTC